MAFFEDNSISHNVESNANFRAWASKIHKALEEVGLVNTTDTGQINLSTVERPAINTYAGYEIWRFNDGEQSTRPIYLKISYGCAAAVSRPSIKMVVGRGSDGAGNLTNASAEKEGKPTGTPSGFGYIHACLYKGSFHLLSCQTTTTTGATEADATQIFSIERVRNAATLVTVDAVAFWGGGNIGAVEIALELFSAGSWESITDQMVVAGTLVSEESFTLGYKAIYGANIATLRGVLGSRLGVLGAGDTGEATIAGETLTYKRGLHSKTFKAAGSGTREHNYVLLHQ